MEIKKITGYHELTIGRWMAAQKVVEKEIEPLDLYLALIDSLYDVDSENLPIDAVTELARSLDWLSTPYKAKAVRGHYDVNGIRYTLRRDLKKWTAAQYFDYVSIGGDTDRLDMQLAIALIPENETYSSATVEARARELRQHLTIDVAMDITSFFFRQFVTSQAAILIYWEAEIKRNARRATGATKIQMLRQLVTLRSLRLLLQNGVGLPWSIELVKLPV